MSGKDFEAFAEALRTAAPVRGYTEGAGDYLARDRTWRMVRTELMGVMARSNPRFDPERFIRASEREQQR
jgi:hypothetical protein